MKNFQEKKCRRCSEIFTPAEPANLYCSGCALIRAEETKKKERVAARLAYRAKEEAKGRVLGYGKGSSNLVGGDHPQYKNGMGILSRMRKIVKEHYKVCQHCGTNLIGVAPKYWCVHHKDRDRTNHHFDNLLLLCKRCHQIEHDCQDAFYQKGATTIPKGSTLK